MTDLLYAYSLTIPAGTQPTSPATLDMLIPPLVVDRVIVRVPPGPHGNVGWQLWYGGGQGFPEQSSAWLVADGANIEFDPPSDMDAGSWTLNAYNVGVYDHTLRVELYVAVPRVIGAGQIGVVTPVTITPPASSAPASSELAALESQLTNA